MDKLTCKKEPRDATNRKFIPGSTCHVTNYHGHALDVAQLGSTGYNLYNEYKNQQYQNKLRELSTDPGAVGKLAAGYTQPLDAGLTKAVANQSQAYLAERGLSDSPEISQQVESQAIAPYIQQNQQAGYQDALTALGLGGGAIPPALQQQNSLSALAKAFSRSAGSRLRHQPSYLRAIDAIGNRSP